MESGARAMASIHDDFVRVHFAHRPSYADFHLRWLRHNCDLDRHPTTRERTVDSSELPDVLGVRDARVEADELRVTWSHDDRVSSYRLDWLWAHAYAIDRPDPPAPLHDLAEVTVDAAGLEIPRRVEAALALLDRKGVAVVRRDPTLDSPPEDETERIVDAFARAGLRVIPTHFGRIEDLRTDNTTNANTDQLGYTDAPVDLHTDQPFIDSPPRYQLLQCIRPAPSGGESYVVDAFAVARVLAAKDRAQREILGRVPVRFHRKQKAFESLVISPILSESSRGNIVRYSYFTMDPHNLPFDELEAFYRAYDRYARLVRDPKYQVRFTLGPGDFLVYDNHRMLHARTGFSGARWLRGIYFDR